MIRPRLLPILLGLTFANAHIVFNVPELSCDTKESRVGCLRGQVCSDGGKCEVASKYATNERRGPLDECGSEICDPLSPSPNKRGQSSAEGANVIPRPVTNSAPPGEVTIDGTCGVDYQNTVCGDWDRGSCCSPYGWCGNTTGHCGFGCQSGPCLDDKIVEPIGPMSKPPPSIPGVFKVVGQSGVPVMTAILMPNGKVIFLDKVENYTQIRLSNGQYAYSAEYDPATNEVVGLAVKTNPFCCGGAFLADGRVISVGGNGPLPHVDPTVGDGFKGIRYLERGLETDSLDGESWHEPGHQLSTPRWYPTVQVLPDGRLFVVSGSVNGLDPTVASNNNPTYEILDRNGYPYGESHQMQILVKNQPYYMYPFIHLLRDGTMFVFVSKSAEIFDVDSGTTVRTLPDLRGDYRTYPNTGGSVLLPLRSSDGWEPEVMVCGGGAYQDRTSPTDPSCGRIRPLADDPKWELDSMPKGRGMVEGILLLDGTTLWINGCNRGAQGYGLGTDPIYDAWIYDPKAPLGKRWATAGTTPIARLYHSAALLLLDGRVMVAGSNPAEQPILVANPKNPMEQYPTEFRVEIYTPSYLLGDKQYHRPRDVWVEDRYVIADGSGFMLYFTCEPDSHELEVILYHGGFVTHSLHMNHRMIYLDTDGWEPGDPEQEIWVYMPPDSKVAPPGPYVLYVVVDGVPSIGQFIMVEYPGQFSSSNG